MTDFPSALHKSFRAADYYRYSCGRHKITRDDRLRALKWVIMNFEPKMDFEHYDIEDCEPPVGGNMEDDVYAREIHRSNADWSAWAPKDPELAELKRVAELHIAMDLRPEN